MMAKAPISALSVLPGELCGYSGQKLMGTLSDTRGSAVEFATTSRTSGPTRATTWSPIHVKAPDRCHRLRHDQRDLLTGDFEIRIP